MVQLEGLVGDRNKILMQMKFDEFKKNLDIVYINKTVFSNDYMSVLVSIKFKKKLVLYVFLVSTKYLTETLLKRFMKLSELKL